ncbi:MAG TPA: adenylate/guanylate cyclase domain-containing protein [Planctomycetota bacterium]|nr:adenylate/guanylate cyclase domain-containing protein [Planctomycetota bacterium]
MGITSSLTRLSRSVDLSHSPAELWPILSATDRLNREWGLPSVEYTPTPNERGGADLQAQAKMLGLNMKWDEEPYEWIEPVLWRVKRHYKSGPFREGVFSLQLEARPTGGSRATWAVDFVPANFASAFVLRIGLNDWLGKAVKVAKAVDEYLDKKSPTPFVRRYKKAEINNDILENALNQIAQLGSPETLVQKLAADLRDLPDDEVTRMRPFEVADRWKESRMDVLVLFMRAVRAGLLDLSWQVICPHCRGASAGKGSLKQVRNSARCDFCNIEFATEFDRSVEARFTVNAAVRKSEDRLYCVGGPGKTPHILAQVRIQPKERRSFSLTLKPGNYRLRATQFTNAMNLRVDAGTPGSTATVRTRASGSGFDAKELTAAGAVAQFEIENACDGLLDVKVEHADWLDTAATGVITTSLSEFYDFAAKDTVLPDEDLSVRSVSLLFSDLRGSTALYRTIGDAAAYALVREHFKLMQEVLHKHNGGVVKTIGDSVMAVFSSAAETLHCCFEIQRAFVEMWNQRPQMAPIVVKLGFHRGPCIVVHPNSRIDYFGSTVNIASRVQGESKGGDIVLLREVFDEPATQAVLKEYKYDVEFFNAELRGIAGEVKLVRLSPEWAGKHLPQGTLFISKPHAQTAGHGDAATR